MERHLEWWKIKTSWCTYFLNYFDRSHKSFQNLNYLVKGVGCTVTLTTIILRENCSLNFSHSHFFVGDMAWSHGVLIHQFWVLNLILAWDFYWIVSSFRELVCVEWFAIQYLLPHCLIDLFILLLGALPEITIKSKPLTAFYWGQIWTEIWWDLSSFRIIVIFWTFSKCV